MIFKLVCEVTVSAHTEVDAASLEDAIEISKEREVVVTTGHDGAEVGEQWLLEDADGSPSNIHEG